VPLGVLALADLGATVAAIVTIGGIWAAAVGVMLVVPSFEVERLPKTWTRSWKSPPASAGNSELSLLRAVCRSFVSVRWVVEVALDRGGGAPKPLGDLRD
jgi:hypothetical protein